MANEMQQDIEQATSSYLLQTAERYGVSAHFNDGLNRWIIRSEERQEQVAVLPEVLYGMNTVAIDNLVRGVAGVRAGELTLEQAQEVLAENAYDAVMILSEDADYGGWVIELLEDGEAVGTFPLDKLTNTSINETVEAIREWSLQGDTFPSRGPGLRVYTGSEPFDMDGFKDLAEKLHIEVIDNPQDKTVTLKGEFEETVPYEELEEEDLFVSAGITSAFNYYREKLTPTQLRIYARDTHGAEVKDGWITLDGKSLPLEMIVDALQWEESRLVVDNAVLMLKWIIGRKARQEAVIENFINKHNG